MPLPPNLFVLFWFGLVFDFHVGYSFQSGCTISFSTSTELLHILFEFGIVILGGF
jgi:hypothetical protein